MEPQEVIYTPEQMGVLRYALTELIELLKSPTSADRDADAAQADRNIKVASDLLDQLAKSQEHLKRAQESMAAICRHDAKLEDEVNGGKNAQPPTGDDYNEIYGFAMTAYGYLGGPVGVAGPAR